MADIHTDSSGSNTVAIVALIILVAVAILFFVYGLPMLQNGAATPSDIQVNIPNPTQPAPAQ